MVKIKTYEELLKYAEKNVLTDKPPEEIKLDKNLDFTIKIIGDSWDGSIDYRLAKFIVSTQKSLDLLFKEIGIELAEKDRPIVKFRVKEGCTELYIEITKALKALFENMTSGQKTFIAALLIGSMVGLLTANGIKGYKTHLADNLKEIQLQEMVNEQQVKQQEATLQIVESLADKIPTYEKPMRGLIHDIQDSDFIQSSVNETKFSKAEIKKEYPGKSKFKAKSVYIDGVYTIIAVKLETGRITLEQGTHRFDCQSSLNPAEIEDLFAKVKDAYANEKVFDLNLKITANYFKGSKKIKKPVIYEIGPARDGAVSLDSILN